MHTNTNGNRNERTGTGKLVLIVAGEASGDLHGGNLVRSMKRIDSSCRFYGIGGRKMREEGVDLIADSADMAVVGLTEVTSKLNMIMKVMSRLKKSLRELKPDMAILIDYPDFNLPLAGSAKKCGVKVFYYISPQVWAWRKGRIGKIKKTVDKMVVILPFEEEMYHAAGVDATFVGHPLLDAVKKKYTREEARKRFGLQEGGTTIGILPGSRQSEVVRLLPEMLKAAEIIAKKISPVQFILPLADTLDMTFVSHIVKKHPIPVRIIQNESYDVIGCADVVMVASGTATLETALMETPMVIIYKVSSPSYFVGKMVIKVDHIGMVNIIGGKRIVPELIQDNATPENIANEICDILKNPDRMNCIKQDLKQIRDKLGIPGAAERAAKIACDMLNPKH
ncbi:MAG: lipid-A-disaccharide synthase [Deltaproteobacteria bacterium]|nr:lipid-A-disaccharide synthase [Deltaproteobacteria bacterium]